MCLSSQVLAARSITINAIHRKALTEKAITTVKIPVNYVGACWCLYTLIGIRASFINPSQQPVFLRALRQFLKEQTFANIIEINTA